ncbi:MAG: hypothetical protein KAJ62_05770 [Desulfobacteraceae bacterium]|nr:hypothetical protein [Desulfobacteraceae bacterium]
MRLNKTLFEKAESYNDKGNSTLLFSSSFLLILILVPALTLFVNSCAHQAPNPPVSESTIKEQKALSPEQTSDAKVVKKVKIQKLAPLAEIEPELMIDDKMSFEDKLFSFSARRTSLRDVLLALAKEAEFNLVIGKHVDATQEVSVEFNNLPIKQAMDEILEAYDYFYRIKGTVLKIKAVEERFIKFDYPLVFSKPTSNVGGDMLGSSSGEDSSGISAEFSVTTEIEDEASLNIWKKVKAILKPGQGSTGPSGTGEVTGLLSEIGRATVDSASGTILVIDRPYNLNLVEEFLSAMKKSLLRQVVIEAKIMEVQLNHRHQYGIDWSALDQITDFDFDFDVSLMPTANTGNFSLSLGKVFDDVDISALIDAIKIQGNINTISSPRLNVLNNQSASISVGRVIPYLDFDIETVQAGDTVSYQAVPTVKKAQAGVNLGITPQISEDGIITLHVLPVITDQVGEQSFTYNGTTWEVPIFDTRQVDTIVRARDGETIILGGMIQNDTNDTTKSVPILGKIPIVGTFLFSNQSRESNKIELVILLTPRIVEQ